MIVNYVHNIKGLIIIFRPSFYSSRVGSGVSHLHLLVVEFKKFVERIGRSNSQDYKTQNLSGKVQVTVVTPSLSEEQETYLGVV